MSNLANSITRFYNVKNKRLGPIFLPQFKSKRINSIEQLVYVSRYIHSNQYASGLIKNINDIFECPYSSIKEYIGDNELIVIDEAHLIPNIGINLKIMVDNVPNIRIIITGSSSFDLANQIGEPLVGRKFTYLLYPISFLELKPLMSGFEIGQFLEKVLVYGSYPEVMSKISKKARIQTLSEITNSYLFKDILIFEGIKNSTVLLNLLRLIAFQIGAEVSHSELGNSLGIDKKTVARYLNLLEQTYIITPLHPYFTNQRKSVIKKNKYYFLDLGVRNTIIGNFNSVSQRNDLGALWENFVVAEFKKRNNFVANMKNLYFWRTYDGQEVDLVEEKEGKLYGYEIKWNKARKNAPKAWGENYKNASWKVITKDNYF